MSSEKPFSVTQARRRSKEWLVATALVLASVAASLALGKAALRGDADRAASLRAAFLKLLR
jgi:hypothetical protein